MIAGYILITLILIFVLAILRNIYTELKRNGHLFDIELTEVIDKKETQDDNEAIGNLKRECPTQKMKGD